MESNPGPIEWEALPTELRLLSIKRRVWEKTERSILTKHLKVAIVCKSMSLYYYYIVLIGSFDILQMVYTSCNFKCVYCTPEIRQFFITLGHLECTFDVNKRVFKVRVFHVPGDGGWIKRTSGVGIEPELSLCSRYISISWHFDFLFFGWTGWIID